MVDQNYLFDKIVNEIIRSYLDLNPLAGSYLGLHEYDYVVVRMDKKWLSEFQKTISDAVEKLREVRVEYLSSERRIDYEILYRGFKLTLRELVEWPTHKMIPYGLMYTGEHFTIFLTRPYLPRDHVLKSIESKLVHINDIVLAPFDLIEEPYKLWIELSLKVAEGSKILFDLIKSYGLKHGVDWSREVEEALNTLSRGISEAKKLVERSRPGFKPIGRELFIERLRSNFIPESPEELRKHGYREAEKYRSLMFETAKSMGCNSIEEALYSIRERCPRDIDELFKLHRESVEKTRRFIIEKEIIELPIGEYVEVIETPPHLKPLLPFAAYMSPEVFHYSNMGLYMVTKPDSVDMLKHFNIYDILNTTIHEAYPGHHVQLCYSKNAPTIARKVLISSADLIEGWAHYCEWLMLEEGIDNSLEFRFKVLHDALWRAVRVYVDVELSTGMIGFEEAVDKLVKDAYLPREGAYSEALRYTLSPAYQICYNYGKVKILELRDRVRKILGEKYSHKLFHKLLLEEGSLPINILYNIVLEKAEKYLKK